jgi:hypothetical protein
MKQINFRLFDLECRSDYGLSIAFELTERMVKLVEAAPFPMLANPPRVFPVH